MIIVKHSRAREYAACVLAIAAFMLAVCAMGPTCAFAADASSSEQVYVNGTKGDDANPGTKAESVKTFAKAKALLESTGAGTIYVTGALQVSGSAETWTLDGKTLKRAADYHGELVTVKSKASLTLSNIVIDGNSSAGATGISQGGSGEGGSLVGVYGGSTLTVGEGAYVQNNSIESHGNWYPEGGGGIFAQSSTVNIEGGTVRNNEAVYGGGVYGISDAVINMSSGSVTGNRALQGASAKLSSEYGGSGGGICAADGTDVNFSGGTISDNTAYERGGGISMGTHYASRHDSPVLTMTGGTISGNSAGDGGGGIFVQAGYSGSGNSGTPTYAIARITAGTITDNTVTADGNGSAMFGGGGIYVNGYSSQYASFHNGELYLNNAEISSNSASIAGGGYAACPVSTTDIELTNGSVMYGNSTDDGNAREIYILSSLYLGTHSGNPPYVISPSMLGGGAYQWVYDDGSEVPLSELTGTLDASQDENLSLSNSLTASSSAVEKALSLATVHIVSNTSATRGGGIGSNGSVFIGKTVDTTDISVEKTWDDADDKDGVRPDSVKVELYRDGEYVGYQKMTADENGEWKTTFKNLPTSDADGNAYTYTVKEQAVDGYACAVSGSAEKGFTLTNTRTVDVTGTKKWDDDDNASGTRPDKVTVNLLRDGSAVDSASVSADTNWKFSFMGLPKYDPDDGHAYVYTVEEDAVDGYTPSVSGDASEGFVITNTRTETPTPPSGSTDTPSKNGGGNIPSRDTSSSSGNSGGSTSSSSSTTAKKVTDTEGSTSSTTSTEASGSCSSGSTDSGSSLPLTSDSALPFALGFLAVLAGGIAVLAHRIRSGSWHLRTPRQ